MLRANKGVKGFTKVTRLVDEDTGELLSSTHDIVYSKNTAEFYTMNMENWTMLSRRLTSATEIRVAHLLAERTEFNSARIKLTRVDREEIRQEVGISHNSTFSTVLASLREKGILVGSQDEWYINPSFIWKGSLKARRLLLKSESGKKLVQLFYRSKYDDHVNGSNTGGDSEEH